MDISTITDGVFQVHNRNSEGLLTVKLGLFDSFVPFKRPLFHLNVPALQHENKYIVGIPGNSGSRHTGTAIPHHV